MKLLRARPARGRRRYTPVAGLGIEKHRVIGYPEGRARLDEPHRVSDLTLRTSIPRFTRITNALSKKMGETRARACDSTVWCNLVKIRAALRDARPEGRLGR